jgi:hypothetical protein
MEASAEISSLSAFVEFTLRLGPGGTLFRGHRSARWRLTPTLGRLPIRSDRTFRDVERELVDRFKAQRLPYLQRDASKDDDWDTLAVAQHHSLATRLLDWTTNPLVALWFAVHGSAAGAEPGAVFAFVPAPSDFADRQAETPYEVRKTRFFRPSDLTQRIIVQSGWFSVHRFHLPRDVSGPGRFSTLDRVTSYKNRFTQILIPAAAFGAIRRELDMLGVNEATLFPDLDGLSRHLNWSVSPAPDPLSEEGGDETTFDAAPDARS